MKKISLIKIFIATTSLAGFFPQLTTADFLIPTEMHPQDRTALKKLAAHLKLNGRLELDDIQIFYEPAPDKDGEKQVYVYADKTPNDMSVSNLLDKKGRLITLNISGRYFSRFDLLRPFTKLRSLSMVNNIITNMSSFPDMPNLEELILYKNNITIFPQLGLPKLRYLDLTYNKISALPGISYFKNLETLKIYDPNKHKKLTSIRGLSKLRKLRILELGGHPITNFTGIQNLTELTRLDLWSSNLKNLDQIKNLTKLRYLDLGSTKIKSLRGINKLTKLENLNISGTNISNLKGLEGLKHLRVLSLFGVKASTLSPLSTLVQLERVDISDDCDITDYTPLLALQSLQKLYSLKYTIANPYQQHIVELLQERGEKNSRVASREKERKKRRMRAESWPIRHALRKKVDAWRESKEKKRPKQPEGLTIWR